MGCEQDEGWETLRTVCCSPKDAQREGPGGVRGLYMTDPRGQVPGLRPVTGDCSHGGTARGERAEELGASTLISLLGRTDCI